MERKKEVAVESPVSTAGATLIAVVMTSVNCQRVDGTVSLIGFKQPTNIVLITPAAKRAFRITGEEISLEQLILEVPELKETLGRAK
jgi:hypothetical protein